MIRTSGSADLLARFVEIFRIAPTPCSKPS
jgi:hypothetical protein